MAKESKGQPTTFHCEWCQKKVAGFLISDNKDFIKGTGKKEYVHPDCPYRVTKVHYKL